MPLKNRPILHLTVSDSWIYQCQGDIRHNHAQENQGADEHDVGQNQIDVLLPDRLVHEPADSGIGEYDLQDERAGKEARKKIGAACDVWI